MPLSENLSERLVYKFYSSGAITAGAEPDPTSAPAATGGQILRHVSHNLSLTKTPIRPNEKRTDRQRAMGRHGSRRVAGTINGLLSPGTYAELFQAVLRGTWAAAVTASQSDFTSCAADNSTSTFIFGGGNPVTKGLKVGDIIVFTGLSDADNNSKNFVITGFSGGSNRTVAVKPAPDTMTADTSFSLTTTKSLIIPASSHVSRLAAFEVYNVDTDLARLYTESRLTGLNLAAPPDDNATVNFGALGRNQKRYTAGSAPFFASPTAATTTGFCAGSALSGFLIVDGAAQGVITGFTLGLDLQASAPAVSFNNLVPEIFLRDAMVGGEMTAFLDGHDRLDEFDLETEIAALLYLPSTTDANAPSISIYLPRIKLMSADESDDGSGGKVLRIAYDAGPYEGSGAGITPSTIRICDTNAP